MPDLYQGLWPQNVSRLAKYAIRFKDNAWKVTVLHDLGDDLRYLAVEEGGRELAHRINAIKKTMGASEGGVFYVNEYRHVLVPVTGDAGSGVGSHYYYAGKSNEDFRFEFEGTTLTTRPVDRSGASLNPGDKWVGPRPGIPYVLAAGGGDIYYETPALTDDAPARVRPNVTRKVQLSKVLSDKVALASAVRPIGAVRGHTGGRFYVNEHGAMFSPIDAGDGNGLNYLYCGQIDRNAWFPEPRVTEID